MYTEYGFIGADGILYVSDEEVYSSEEKEYPLHQTRYETSEKVG